MKGINFAIGMGIAILLPLLVLYGVNTFSPPPEWQNDHSTEHYEKPAAVTMTPEERKEIARQQQIASDSFASARQQHQLNLFLVALPTGLIAVIAGTFIRVPALGPGLVFGGVLTLVEGYLIYWQKLDDPIKFISLLVALIVLSVTAYKRFGDQKKEQSQDN